MHCRAMSVGRQIEGTTRQTPRPAGRAIAYAQKLPSSRPEPSAARRSGGTFLLPRQQEEVPRLRRPLGGFARDDGSFWSYAIAHAPAGRGLPLRNYSRFGYAELGRSSAIHRAKAARWASRHVQAFLGAPPQHVLGLDRPFLAHQVAHLGLVEVAAEMAAEIGHRLYVLQQLVQPGAVPARQSTRTSSLGRPGFTAAALATKRSNASSKVGASASSPSATRLAGRPGSRPCAG